MAVTGTTRESSKAKARSKGPNAVTLLTQDHQEVKKLFQQYDKSKDKMSDAEKRKLSLQICRELTIHATVEEEIFYPALRAATDEDAQELLDEAEVEHASAKDLIAQIEGMKVTDELYDAKVKVLAEYIDHHVKEEQGEMFPEAKKSDLDLNEVGSRIQQRKEEMKA